jgi:Protein of unknown function (DUF3761)
MRKLLFALCLFSSAAQAKPRTVVQLVATTTDPSGFIQSLFLILPDGSHAEVECNTINCGMGLESFHPEKRKTFDCLRDGSTYSQTHCLTSPESFYSDRKGNDLTIYGGSGGKVYHISGTWEELDPGTISRPPNPSPVWTAICNDDTISYSKERSGTCADHNGVKIWREPQQQKLRY